jgi:hypothetical protein
MQVNIKSGSASEEEEKKEIEEVKEKFTSPAAMIDHQKLMELIEEQEDIDFKERLDLIRSNGSEGERFQKQTNLSDY